MMKRIVVMLGIAMLGIALSLGLPVAPAGADDKGGGLGVGVAAVELKADDSMVIAGSILGGHVKGQEGQLRATAVVLEKPKGHKIAIVSCDVLFVQRDFVDRALGAIEKATGIPPSHVLVSATHTHHAPSVTDVHGYVRDKVFTRRLQEAIVRSVVDADERIKSGARFYFRLGEEKTVGQNSRLLLRDGKILWVGSRKDAVRPTGKAISSAAIRPGWDSTATPKSVRANAWRTRS